jgi:quercetin 2,3-dioxygenase
VNKAVLGVFPRPQAHWVGDGFPVRSLFSYDQLGRHISPFLLLDYAAPTVFPPLWVNLPAQHKMAPPRYQSILSAQIPQIALPGGAGSLRVIAGNYSGQQGPAATFSELNVWDVRLQSGAEITLSVPAEHNAAIAVLRGAVTANESREARDAELVLLEGDGSDIRIAAGADSTILVLSGVPIAEPISGYGPFVMNTRQEIETAMNDFRLGKFGRLPPLDLGADLAIAGT